MGRLIRRTRVATGLALACVAVAGAGCGGDDDSSSTATVTIEQSSAQTDARVEVDAGKSVSVLVPENPTTGYELEIQREPDAAIATATEGDFEQSGPETEGSGGFHEFDIQGKAAGRTTVVLQAIGPGDERGDTYTVEIVVR